MLTDVSQSLTCRKWCAILVIAFSTSLISSATVFADGKVFPPRKYKGSLEEKAQEAIIIFESSEQTGEAIQDLILKISVVGGADEFAWIIPFPNEPETEKVDPKLFKELFDYVQFRQGRRRTKSRGADSKSAESDGGQNSAVEVLSRKIVGDFDITVVREKTRGSLNTWLGANEFQQFEDADDILEFYRQKEYVFACIRVSAQALAEEKQIDSHPLRFRFKTGGRDGMFFPMKLTGLQNEPFDVNLYVFYPAWINDKLNEFGYVHRGFQLIHRDWDSKDCEKNAGKTWSSPRSDPYLDSAATRIETVSDFFANNYPGKKFYLTNIQARKLKPGNVRKWDDDLWMFPYYTNTEFVPYDARENGAAADGYKNVSFTGNQAKTTEHGFGLKFALGICAGAGLAIVGLIAFHFSKKRR